MTPARARWEARPLTAAAVRAAVVAVPCGLAVAAGRVVDAALQQQGVATTVRAGALLVVLVAALLGVQLAALAVHDRGTRGHCERVRAVADLIGEQLGLAPLDRERLRWVALLHDVGKLDVDRRILTKPSPLDDVEWEAIRAHPSLGAALVEPLQGFLGPFTAAVGQHHERWDGTGYPAGLAGPQITLGARIVAVADTFEVMTSRRRSYRSPVDDDSARRELVATAGTQLDPAVVRALLDVPLGRLRWTAGGLLWLAHLPALSDHGTPVDAVDVAPAALPPDGAHLPLDAHLHATAVAHPLLVGHPSVDGSAADSAMAEHVMAGARRDEGDA